MYNKLLLGKISNTLAAADMPYVLAIKMVVITDSVQVAALRDVHRECCCVEGGARSA